MKAKKIKPGLNQESKELLKLNDSEIKNHISSFSYDKGEEIKQKSRSFTPFDVHKNSRLKGLHLYQGRDDKGNLYPEKYFYVGYKVKGSGNTKWFPLGKFIPGQFGVKEVEDKLTELNKKRTYCA